MHWGVKQIFHETLGKVDRGYLVELTRELVRVPSVNPPGDEKQVAQVFSREMARLGMEVTIREFAEGRPNVLGVLRGKQSKRVSLARLSM